MLTRRDFLKKTRHSAVLAGATALGLGSILGCASLNPKKDWSKVSAHKFDIKAFNEWFRRNELYNEGNPNLKWPHFTMHTNLGAFTHGWSPGLSYTVPYGEIMVAAAPGYVGPMWEDTVGAGGMIVEIQAGESPLPVFLIEYAHLSDEIYVKPGQWVNRGDPIAKLKRHHEHAKLMVKEGIYITDPDNYGLNHCYMDYPSGPLEMDKKIKENSRLVGERLQMQQEIIWDLDNQRIGNEVDELRSKWHEGGRWFKSAHWSRVEMFRYLSILYTEQPKLFPSVGKEQFESMRKEFYGKQPLIMTLPWIKGGMKKYQ